MRVSSNPTAHSFDCPFRAVWVADGGKRQRNTGAKDRSVSVAQYARTHPLRNSCSEYPVEWTSEMKLLGYA